MAELLKVDISGPDADATMSAVVSGTVNYSNSNQLREQLHGALQRQPGKLILNLADVQHMDSSGIATLVEALQIQRQHQGKLVLCSLAPRVRGMFDISRLDSVFTIVANEDEARAV